MEKKGQAAMEFLMTYGWAILAAVIAIGVLAYFGVFSPGKFVGGSIIINAPFGTTQEYSITTNAIDFVLRNGAGDDVTITNITIGTCTNTTSMIMTDGESKVITVPCAPALTVGKISEDIKITYKTGEELIELKGTGTIRGNVA